MGMLRGNRRELKRLLERARLQALVNANAENILRGHEGNNEESPPYILGRIPSLGMPLLRRETGRGSELLQNSPANQDQTPQYFNSLLNSLSTNIRLNRSFSSPSRPSSDGEGPRRKKRNK